MKAKARSLIAAALALSLGASAATAQGSPDGAGAVNGAAASKESGIASWYGADFHGRPTSSGETYDKEKLTCAHRTLAFGTYILVRNLDNGSSVVVRVNDRGPFAKNRIIDLSEAAARIIGMIPTGTARVSLEAIPKEEALAWKGGSLDGAVEKSGSPAQGGAPSQGAASGKGAAPGGSQGAEALPADARVRIQVASYSNEANARSTALRLEASGLKPAIEVASGRFRVAFPDLSTEEARAVSRRLDSLGYRGYLVTTVRSE
jgi:rare lipoprotein A